MPDDPQNTSYIRTSLLVEYLNPSVRKSRSNIIASSDRKPFTFEQLAEFRRKYPNRTLTISIDPYKKDQQGNAIRDEKGYLAVDTDLQNKLTEKGLYSSHDYTLLAVNEENKTITIVNPWDSSKAIVLDATALFFNQAVQANNVADENPIATTPAQEETA